MKNPEIMRDVPPGEVQRMIDIYAAIGAQATKEEQPDHNFTVTAVFAAEAGMAPVGNARTFASMRRG